MKAKKKFRDSESRRANSSSSDDGEVVVVPEQEISAGDPVDVKEIKIDDFL